MYSYRNNSFLIIINEMDNGKNRMNYRERRKFYRSKLYGGKK